MSKRNGSGEEKGSLRAMLSSGGAGIMFILFWLGLGVPLAFSALAGVAGYGALWLVLGNAFGRKGKESSIGTFVDHELARKTVAQGTAAANALEATISRFDPRDGLVPKLKRISALLRSIARDVEADPKDASAASVFISIQGDTAVRIARLALDLDGRGAARDQLANARKRIDSALDGLITAHERHLEHLQEDNLAELQSELDVLEESLDIEGTFERELREGTPGSPAELEDAQEGKRTSDGKTVLPG